MGNIPKLCLFSVVPLLLFIAAARGICKEQGKQDKGALLFLILLLTAAAFHYGFICGRLL